MKEGTQRETTKKNCYRTQLRNGITIRWCEWCRVVWNAARISPVALFSFRLPNPTFRKLILCQPCSVSDFRFIAGIIRTFQHKTKTENGNEFVKAGLDHTDYQKKKRDRKKSFITTEDRQMLLLLLFNFISQCGRIFKSNVCRFLKGAKGNQLPYVFAVQKSLSRKRSNWTRAKEKVDRHLCRFKNWFKPFWVSN